jgi:hypothetical protein
VGNHRLVRALLNALLILVTASGCQMLHPQAPINVEVRDAETQAPIDGAHVRVWHNASHADVTSGTTGPDGMVHIPAPPVDDTPLVYELMAKGYMARQMDHPAKETQSSVILEMFAEPRPVLELIVPTGYRGVLRATVRVQNDYAYPPHQRLFSCTVPASAVVEAVVPPIFGRGLTPNISFRYADGTPLLRDAKPFEIGCRCLKSDPDSEYVFVIGTQYEADEIRRAIKKAGGGNTSIGQESMTGYGHGR